MAHGSNTRGVVAIAIAFAACCATSLPAVAQVADTQFRGVGLELGTVNGSATDLGSQLALTADLGTLWKPWIDLSASIGTWSADLTDLGRDRMGSVRSLSVRSIGRIEMSGDAWRLRPHLLGGVGLHRVRVDIPEDDALESALDGTRLAGEVGLGGSYALRDNVAGRLEVTRVLMSDFSHWGVSAGITWQFRNGNRGTMSRAMTRAQVSDGARYSTPTRPRVEGSGSARRAADEAATIADIRMTLDAIGERIAGAEREREQATHRAEEARADRITGTEARAALLAVFAEENVDVEISPDRAQFHVRPAALRFPVGSTALSDDGSQFIARVSRVLRKYSRVQVIIEAHTDQTGSWARNFTVGRKRADAVHAAFVDNAVSASRLSVLSLGSGTPFDPARNATAHAVNRRVDLRFFLVD